MLFKLNKLFPPFVLILFLTISEASGQSPDFRSSEPVELGSGWFYRWGDSPINKTAIPKWVEEQNDSLWSPLDPENFLQPSGTENIIWYRTKLPDVKWVNPAIFIPPVVLACEVYLGKDLVYQTGEILPLARNKFSGVKSHIIPLGKEYRNETLTLRIFSDKGEIGIDVSAHPIIIGNEGEVYTRLIRSNIDSVIIGFVFTFIGLFSLFVFLKRLKRRNYLLLTFGFFSLCAGLFYVSFDHTGRLFIEPDFLRYYIGFSSFLLFPVGLYAFLEKLIGKNIVIRRVWQLHLIYAIAVLALDVLNILLIPQQRFYYSLFFVGTIIVTLSITIREAFAGNNEIKIFISAFTVYAVTGLHDILIGIEVLPQWYWLSQWGALVFVLALAYIVERRFAEAHNQLEHYSRELEIKSKKLDKYSQVLEQKVAERTQDLNLKNRELEATVKQIQEMQHQLIMHEKMASLGNLVAGVAHEVNNPIGAVKSSAHVLTRCIAKIKNVLTNSKSIEDIRNDDQFQETLSMLQENNKVINTASERVSEIVLSLKNFARLDEAEFQLVNIHEGIDTTLTLVEHELKNRVEVIKEYGKIPKIHCYPNQLNQVFMNLLVNAAHAIGAKGTITIKTYSRNQLVYVEISDSGKGISRKNLDKIFDPGFTTKSMGVGTGLGLSISYNIIKKHDGQIKVESEEGKGATFTIVLPVKQEEVAQEIAEETR